MIILKNTIFCLVIFILSISTVNAETVVILNKNNPISSLQLNQLTNIFKGKKKHWKNGEEIVIFLPIIGSQAHHDLTRKIFKKNNAVAVSKFYLKAIFQQKFASIPNATSYPINEISETPGGISLIDSQKAPLDGSIKTLRIEGLSEQ